MAQQLEAHTAFWEYLNAVPSTHLSTSQPPVTPAPVGSNASGFAGTLTHMHMHTHAQLK